jgi:signal transduction histidine kinase
MLAVIACAILAVLLALAVIMDRRRERALLDARSRERELLRLVRVTAAELRGPALGLLGHSEQLPAGARPMLIGLCRALLDIAESILDQTDDPTAPRRLREEAVALGPLLEFVVAQVSSQLCPGRRLWRIAPGLAGVVLLADRRALHQILLRVLTSAAMATSDGDSIDISAGAAAATDGQWALRIEDEGAGLAVAAVAGDGLETRGLGLGLSLVRSLMQAHGGGLALQSTSLVGTRAVLSFPVGRVIQGA